MAKHTRAPAPGSFEFVETLIRALDTEKAQGDAFEQLCREFLRNEPRFRHLLKHVWLWNDWPDRWGPDKGIDLVAQTTDGLLWAIQAKAIHPDRSIPKRELDSFLSESNRPDFAYRLVIATTDGVGHNARHTLDGQAIPIGLVLRGDLIRAELTWPRQLDRRRRPQGRAPATMRAGSTSGPSDGPATSGPRLRLPRREIPRGQDAGDQRVVRSARLRRRRRTRRSRPRCSS